MTGPHRRPRGQRPAPRKIVIRISEDEHRLIREAAARHGQGVSLARFVTEAALAAADPSKAPTLWAEGRRRAPSRLLLAEVAAATVAVSRVGNNLNQIARERNITGRLPDGAINEVQKAVTALRQLTDAAQFPDA